MSRKVRLLKKSGIAEHWEEKGDEMPKLLSYSLIIICQPNPSLNNN